MLLIATYQGITIPTSAPLPVEKRLASLALKPYFFLLCCNARSNSSEVAKRACDSTHSPMGSPLIPHGITRTRWLLRKRFTLPVSLLVTTKIFSLSTVNHTGVATACPFFLNVSRMMYWWPESSDVHSEGLPSAMDDITTTRLLSFRTSISFKARPIQYCTVWIWSAL